MRPPRILFVDDERDQRDLAVRHANLARIDCHVAEDGAQAVKVAVERSPDLILLDILLPAMSGFGVLKELRKNPLTARIPVIFVTGAPDKDLLSDATGNMDVAGFVRKPIHWSELIALVRRTLAAKPLSPSQNGVILRGSLRIDPKLRRAFANGVDLKLGPKRYAVLALLAGTKDGIDAHIIAGIVWGSATKENLQALVETISRLRADLIAAFGRDLIVTLPRGYKLIP